MPRVPRPFPWLRLAWLLAVLLCVRAAPGSAQSDLPGPPLPDTAVAAVDPSRPAVRYTPTGLLAAGGALGGVVGLLAGGYAGAGIEAMGECSEWCGFAGAIIGGIIGESFGVALGVHAFNRGQGQLLPSALSSLAIAAGGLLVLSQLDGSGAGAVVVWSVPVAQIATAIHIERISSIPPARSR